MRATSCCVAAGSIDCVCVNGWMGWMGVECSRKSCSAVCVVLKQLARRTVALCRAAPHRQSDDGRTVSAGWPSRSTKAARRHYAHITTQSDRRKASRFDSPLCINSHVLCDAISPRARCDNPASGLYAGRGTSYVLSETVVTYHKLWWPREAMPPRAWAMLTHDSTESEGCDTSLSLFHYNLSTSWLRRPAARSSTSAPASRGSLGACSPS